ncbi:MAG TPA: peptidylprolyl isomerase [Vicinamibacterales bacterium]|nr:peptidylprolyl isomerase [Vicinamibacterales bacterium]
MKKALLAGVLAAALGTAVSAEILEQVLVKVNGEIVTQTEFHRIQLAALREMPNQPDLSRVSDAEISKLLAQVTPQAIVTMIDEMLLMQRATELGMTVSDAQFTQVLESIRKDNKIESQEAFEAALKSEGLTLAQLKQMLSKRILIGQVQQREVGSRVDVTEEEERAYYNANPTEFATTPSVTLREIQINAVVDPVKKQASVGALDDAREKAAAIRARIAKGEAFEKVAAEVSDAPSKANGGLIGPISRDEMNEELLKMLSKMKVGEMTPVINTAAGAQFFKLESSIESTTLPFEAARARIADRISTEKMGAEFKKYMTRLRSQAIIDWKNDDLRQAWEIGIAAEPTF